MKKLIKLSVRAGLRSALREHAAVELHRCMNGDVVKFGSDDCIQDISDRIDDAAYERDSCPGRTDSREHYNGILKVLRRKFRRAKKQGLGV